MMEKPFHCQNELPEKQKKLPDFSESF